MDNNTELDTMNELDDLGNLFEFGDIDLNIPDMEPGQFGQQVNGHQHQQQGTHSSTNFEDLGDPTLLQGNAVADFAVPDSMSMMLDHQNQHGFTGQQDNQMPSSIAFMMEPIYQAHGSQSHKPKDFQFHGQSGYPLQHIPPTPNSYEMHGQPGAFMGQQVQQYYRPTLEQQRYHAQKSGQVAFTPMASPAGTPQFHVQSDFTTPGAYFSPLSSPMMQAQNAQRQAYSSHPHTAPNSAAPSPLATSFDAEMGGMGDGVQELPNRRKSRRKIATPRNVATTGRAKSSPSQKTQKRKTTSKASETDLRRAVTSQPSPASLQHLDSSETDGTSPEPLGESVMGPPPKPGSKSAQDPASTERRDGKAKALGPAATPKSLLQKRSDSQQLSNGHDSGTVSSQSADGIGGLDDLALPEAAESRPKVASINTRITKDNDENETPRISARKTPKLGPSDTPSSARPPTAQSSPAVAPSPTTASTPAAILKDRKDSKDTRTSKKRGSSVSQPLPRISPSIKPLLPEGSPLHSNTQALLLASKSNYQNLLEGNHLPGVNYPNSLSTGLTSKRTSHKVAEQGRRNRINDALKEMQALVPKASPGTTAAMKESEVSNEGSGSPEGEGDGGAKGSNSSSSKAATVELANEYIKRMQRDFAVREAENEVLRRENEALKRLGGEGRKSGGRSSEESEGVA